MSPRPPKSRTHSDSHGRHLTDYLRVIYKRRWTAGLAFAAVFITGAVLTLKTTPVYEATTQLEIVAEGARRSASLTNVLDEPTTWYEDEFYRTQYRILESRALSWRAIESLGLNRAEAMAALTESARRESTFARVIAWMASLVGTPERIPPPPPDETTAQSAMIDGFRGGLTINPVRNTRLVEVTYRSMDPVLAARAANAIADQYKQQGLKNRFLASKETADWLEQELDGQRKKVEASERALQAYKETHDAVAVDDSQNIVVQKLTDLNQKWTAAKADRWEKEADYKLLQSLRNDPAGLETLPQVVGEPVRADAEDADRDDQGGEAEAPPGLRRQHPAAGRRECQARGRRVQPAHGDREHHPQHREQLRVGQDAREHARRCAPRPGAGSVQARPQEHRVRGAEAERDQRPPALREPAAAGEGNRRGGRVQGQQRPHRRRARRSRACPILPRTKRNLASAFIGGLILAFALVFGFEYMDSRIKTPDDVKQHLELPFLGLVPSIRRRTGASRTPQRRRPTRIRRSDARDSHVGHLLVGG